MTNSDQERFEHLMQPYGGTVTYTSGWIFSQTLRDMRELTPYYLDIVDNDSFNALAISETDFKGIAIFRGLIQTITINMILLVSDEEFFSELDYDQTLGTLDNKYTNSWEFLLKENYSEKKICIAYSLIGCMFLFIAFHELGHLIGGHSEILKNNDEDVDVYNEFPMLSLTDGEAKLRRALEIDADYTAMLNSIKYWRSIYKSEKHTDVLKPMSADESWLIAITSFFYMSEFIGRKRESKPIVNSHPSMDTRLLYVIAFAQTEKSGLIEPINFDLENQKSLASSMKYWKSKFKISISNSDSEKLFVEMSEIDETFKKYSGELEKYRDIWEGNQTKMK